MDSLGNAVCARCARDADVLRHRAMRHGEAALVLLLTTTGNARARTDTRPERTARNMEAIVVTARIREAWLQRASVAVSVITTRR